METTAAAGVTETDRQAVLDEEHLRLLALFHYISGGMTAAFSLLMGLWILFMMAMFSSMPMPTHGGEPAGAHLQGPPALFFVAFGVVCLLVALYGISEIVAGRLIARRRRRVLTIVLAIPRLLFIPYGLILSVFTFMVLDRRSVKALYAK